MISEDILFNFIKYIIARVIDQNKNIKDTIPHKIYFAFQVLEVILLIKFQIVNKKEININIPNIIVQNILSVDFAH
jgi:hypothetical protein